MPIFLTIGAIENEKFEATLEYISPKGVAENGAIQFEIKAKIHLKKGFFIRSGYSANADIVLDERKAVLAIPEKLLQFNGDSAFVEVKTQPQIFVKRYIKTGLSDGINIEIVQGLTKENKIKIPL
jgi:HlyD family secretion protein